MSLPGCTCPADAFACEWHGRSLHERLRRYEAHCVEGLVITHDAMVAAGFEAVRGRGEKRHGNSPIVFRHVNGDIGSIRLRPYSAASVLRFKLDFGLAGASARALRALGERPSRAWGLGAYPTTDPLTESEWRMELTVCREEIAAIASWFPLFLRQSPQLFELPSVELVRGWDRPPYAWSVAANELQRAYQRDEDERRVRRGRAA